MLFIGVAIVVAVGLALLLSFVLAAPFVGVLGLLAAVTAAGGVAAAWAWTCRRLIGGQTGDLIGALHALIEVAVVAILVIFA